MIQELEKTKPRTDVSGTWIQVTFTLAPEHYRLLWENAENEGRTVPAITREIVLKFLNEAEIKFYNDNLKNRLMVRDD